MSAPAPERPGDWRLTVRGEGSGPPTAIRLSRALKWLLRSFGLRAVRVEEIAADPDKLPAAAE
jgi:hypothetical protein